MVTFKNDVQLLFLQPHRISVVVCNNAAVGRSWEIENDEFSEDFSNYLLINYRAVFHLVIDVAEEECRTEALPAVSWRDRKHCVERIRQKHFSGSLLSTTRVRKTKTESAVSVLGISQSALCERLIVKLKSAGSFVKTIHSPVTLAPQVCKQLCLEKGAQLIILRFEERSFRLIACVDSFVVLNRRVESIDSVDQDISGVLLERINETLIYLDRCSIAGWDAPKVNFVGGDEIDPILLSRLMGALGSRTSFDLNGVQAGVGTAVDPVCNAGESTMCFMATMVGKGIVGYEKKSHKREYVTQKIRHGFFALALSLFAGAISTAAIAKKVSEQHADLVETYDRSADLARNSVGENNIDDEPPVEAVRQALVTARLAEMRSQNSPAVFLSYLSGVIGNHPTVSIATVTWERQDMLDEISLQRVLGIVEPIEKLPMELVYKATVSGVIKGNPGSALDAFEVFVSMLRKTSVDSTVVIVEAPFGMSQNVRTTAAEMLESDGNFTVAISTAGAVE